jgi:hypothetical protein
VSLGYNLNYIRVVQDVIPPWIILFQFPHTVDGVPMRKVTFALVYPHARSRIQGKCIET